MSTTSSVFRAGFGAFVLCAVACSTVLGIDRDYYEVADAGDASTSDVSADALADGCAMLAQKFCAFVQPCCSPLGTKTCEGNLLTHCQALIPDIVTGKRNLDPAAFQACLAALDKPILEGGCSLDFVQHTKLALELIPCHKAVTGSVQQASACLVDEDCMALPDQKKALRCGTTLNLCIPTGELKIDDPCLVATATCGPGQYCAPATGPVGKCALASSTTCNTPYECGPGHQCTGGNCETGTATGQSCPPIAKGYGCETGYCNSGTCDLWPAVPSEVCAGAAWPD